MALVLEPAYRIAKKDVTPFVQVDVIQAVWAVAKSFVNTPAQETVQARVVDLLQEAPIMVVAQTPEEVAVRIVVGDVKTPAQVAANKPVKAAVKKHVRLHVKVHATLLAKIIARLDVKDLVSLHAQEIATKDVNDHAIRDLSEPPSCSLSAGLRFCLSEGKNCRR